MNNHDTKKSHIICLIVLSIFCYARLYLLNTTFWDDNCWLLSLYNSSNLDEFLNTGGRELRRVSGGTLTYYLISLHQNSEIYYPVFYTITIMIQTFTSLFIYMFVQKVFQKDHLAFYVALLALLYPIDTTTPIFSTLAYRIGLLFSVISLYTSISAIRETMRWRLIVISLLCAALAQYVFIEGAVALEPARFLLIWHLLSQSEKDRGRIRKTFMLVAGLFLLITIPLVYYKLMYKPYGIYAGTYQSDPLFLLRWRMHRRAIVSLLFINWAYFTKYLLLLRDVLSPWSVVLGLATAIGGYFRLGRLLPRTNEGAYDSRFTNSLAGHLRQNRFVFLLGLAFYIPPVLMYEYAGRVVFNGVDSRHGTLLVIGFALLWGGLFYALYTTLQSSSFRLKFAHALIAGFIGMGVFYHNVNHDLYLASQREQQKFWRAFTDRFQTLPEKCSFLLDVELPTYLYDEPFGTTFGIELYLNMLYAKSSEVKDFKNYIAAPITFVKRFGNLQNVFAQRHPGIGHLFEENEPLYIVKYDNGKILVNDEIVESGQYAPYRTLPVREFDASEDSSGHYPLRNKLAGFYH